MDPGAGGGGTVRLGIFKSVLYGRRAGVESKRREALARASHLTGTAAGNDSDAPHPALST
jgi:hypothetical protein